MKATHLALAVMALMTAGSTWPASGPHENPSAEGTVGLFAVPGAATFPRGSFAFGVLYETLARREGNANVERGAITGALGLSDRVEIFASFEPRVGVKGDFKPFDAAGHPRPPVPRLNDHPFPVEHFKHGLGEIRTGVKYNFLGEPQTYSGLAVDALVKIPTSNQDDGIGTGKADFGANLIASLECARMLGLNGYAGFLLKGDPETIDLAHELHWGLGLQLPTRFWLQGLVEAYGVSYFGKTVPSVIGFDDYTILQGGARLSFANGVALSAGVNRNMSIPDSPGHKLERVGSFLQISFTQRPEPPPPPLPPNRPPSLSCRAESTSVRRGESVRLYAETTDPDHDTVTVRWTASAGTLTPDLGTSVNWTSAGAPAGPASITATASDGRSGIATCVANVIVAEPPAPKPAAATVRRSSCTEFAARSSRLDNRCKAVLDDLAIELRTNPRATLRIFADGDAPADADRVRKVADERAQNAKAYLVQTHGVAASRISATVVPGSSRKIDIEITAP